MSRIEKLNLNNLPQWELYDIYHLLKTDMMANEEDFRKVTVNTFQTETDDDDVIHYEKYVSTFYFDIDTEIIDFTFQVIDTEKLANTYKTQYSLLKNCISNHAEDNGSYSTFNIYKEL